MINKVILIGNLGADPDIRQTQGGKPVGKLSLATTKKVGGEERTEWHQVIVWEKLAELAGHYLKKGSRVYVEGELTYRTFDKQDGSKGYSTEIVAYQMRNLSPRDTQNVAHSNSYDKPQEPVMQKPSEPVKQAPKTNDYESIPF